MRGGRGRGRGGRNVRVVRVSKTPSNQTWSEANQAQVLCKLLDVTRTVNQSSCSKNDAVEYYSVSDLISFAISRVGKLTTKPSTRDQLHSTLKKLLLEDPKSANAPVVDAVYLFSKLLGDGLISISIKQEVCFYNPPLPQYTNPRVIQVVERPKSTPISLDEDLNWSVHQSWYERQKSWRGIQQQYLSKNTDKIDKSPNLQAHYERVRKWVENITQRQLEHYKTLVGENNATNTTFGIEFHTHNTPWKFLTTLLKLFRVSRKIDDKLVDELITCLEENEHLKIENNQVNYLNRAVLSSRSSIPPIAPGVSSIFASTPAQFYEFNKIAVKDENQDTSHLLPILAKIGNPETTFYVFTKESTSKEQPKAVESKPVEQSKPVQEPSKPTEPKLEAKPAEQPVEVKPAQNVPSQQPTQPAVKSTAPSWAAISSKAASVPQPQPQKPKQQPQTVSPQPKVAQAPKKSSQPSKKKH